MSAEELFFLSLPEEGKQCLQSQAVPVSWFDLKKKKKKKRSIYITCTSVGCMESGIVTLLPFSCTSKLLPTTSCGGVEQLSFCFATELDGVLDHLRGTKDASV